MQAVTGVNAEQALYEAFEVKHYLTAFVTFFIPIPVFATLAEAANIAEQARIDITIAGEPVPAGPSTTFADQIPHADLAGAVADQLERGNQPALPANYLKTGRSGGARTPHHCAMLVDFVRNLDGMGTSIFSGMAAIPTIEDEDANGQAASVRASLYDPVTVGIAR